MALRDHGRDDSNLFVPRLDALAGSVEYSAMEKVYQLAESTDHDLIVVDTPPAQHALDFLEAPRRLLEFLDSRIVHLLIHPAFAAGRFGFRVFQRGTQRLLRVIERVSGFGFLEDVQALWSAGFARGGSLENTVVLFVSDHGEELWEHQEIERRLGYEAIADHGHSLYRELLHVPGLLYVPPTLRTQSLDPPGWEPQTVETPVELADFFPTLLDLLGVENAAPESPSALNTTPNAAPSDAPSGALSGRLSGRKLTPALWAASSTTSASSAPRTRLAGFLRYGPPRAAIERKVVGWAIAEHMRSELVVDLLEQGLVALLAVPCDIGVLDAEDERAADVAREGPVEECGPCQSEMRVARRGRTEADTDSRRGGVSHEIPPCC